jgi:hypothetical protein
MEAAKASGNLRKNPKKEKDSHPDLTGKWTDQSGQQYWLSAWRNVNPDGNVWFSLKLGAPVETKTGSYESKKPALVQKPVRGNDFDDDSIPF